MFQWKRTTAAAPDHLRQVDFFLYPWGPYSSIAAGADGATGDNHSSPKPCEHHHRDNDDDRKDDDPPLANGGSLSAVRAFRDIVVEVDAARSTSLEYRTSRRP